MSNIKNYVFNRIDFKLTNSDYWDFSLNVSPIHDTPYYGTNIIAGFDFSSYDVLPLRSPDFNRTDFKDGDFLIEYGIYSSVSWNGGSSSDFDITTFGLTGLDNGNITYDGSIDDDAHTTLLSALTGTTLTHSSLDDKLNLNQVSGATGSIVYPIELVVSTGSTGNYINLLGGFYQGYYKLDGYDYQTLPTRYDKGFTIETLLKLDTTVYPNTLNAMYSGNTGFFYYTGTRAENKFWNVFDGNNISGCTSGSTEFCMDVKETEMQINNVMVGLSATTISVPLSPPPIDLTLITNKFLIFGRSNGLLCTNEQSPDGFGQMRASDYDPDVPFYSKIIRQEQSDFRNQFLIFGRSNGLLCTNKQSADGYGQVRASNYSGSTVNVLELDKDADIIDNAIGFRITPEGSVGYRLLTLSGDCKSVEIVEEYSAIGLITTTEWTHVVVKWVNNNNYDKCDLENGEPRKGKLKFYVNSMLVFVSKELNEFVPKRLQELQEKQVGVPYNVSIGGGTQGLLESMTFDGQDPDDLNLIIQNNFAGTFTGYMSYFNIYNKDLSWCEIKDAYNNKGF
jgi:hypothetical protein